MNQHHAMAAAVVGLGVVLVSLWLLHPLLLLVFGGAALLWWGLTSEFSDEG